jgi:ribosomal-protein-alanine N-acetyltransferase
MAPILRKALPSDYAALHSFLIEPNHIHRHLDWRDTLDWLGRQPFWLMEENSEITAGLACIEEPQAVAWVRLFAASLRNSPDRAWTQLFDPVLAGILELAGSRGIRPPVVVSLALREWYEEMLQRKGFQHHQDIVVFMYDEAPPDPPDYSPALRLRPMRPEDLEEVARLDQAAFEPIWRLSQDDLQFAMEKSAYCTVVEWEGALAGYSMSFSSTVYAHLARLAVRPDLQGRRLGYTLVQDLLEHFINNEDCWGVSLNTQHDNQASLALYRKIGFHETGERFPVYMYPIE